MRPAMHAVQPDRSPATARTVQGGRGMGVAV